MRAVLWSLLATLVGLAMVGGGIVGLIGSISDDDSGSAVAAAEKAKTSSPSECATVAARDPRFRFPHDLSFGIDGTATVQCDGATVTFGIKIDGLEEGTFYDVLLEKGKREEEIGSILAVGVGDGVEMISVGPEVPLKKYDFLTVRVDTFHHPGDDSPQFSAAL